MSSYPYNCKCRQGDILGRGGYLFVNGQMRLIGSDLAHSQLLWMPLVMIKNEV